MSRAEVFETDLLPQPAPNLTREIALRWLADDLPGLLMAAAESVHAEDSETRDALHFLLGDLRELVEACAATLAGKRARVRLDPGLEEEDVRDRTEALARIVSYHVEVPEGGGVYDAGFHYLRRVLLERLERGDGGEDAARFALGVRLGVNPALWATQAQVAAESTTPPNRLFPLRLLCYGAARARE